MSRGASGRRSALRGAGRALGLAAIAVLLTSCDGAAPGFACKVEVDTPDLVQDRVAAGIADCTDIPTEEGAADLPDIALDCLGSTETLSLSDVKGPAMINFWSTTCGPCRKEMPALQEFHEQYAGQVTLLGVNFQDTYPGAAIDFARQKDVTYPSAADACGDLNETDLVVSGLPLFVFVRADGSTTRPVTGGKDSLAEVVEMAEKELDIELATPDPAGAAS